MAAGKEKLMQKIIDFLRDRYMEIIIVLSIIWVIVLNVIITIAYINIASM